MQRFVFAIAVAALTACGGGAATTTTTTTATGTSSGGTDTSSSIRFTNSSAWVIRELYLSPVSQSQWGADQLGAHVIRTGESFSLTNIPCGNYDLKLVDEDGDQCEVRDTNICAENSGVDISSQDLIHCQNNTAQH
jgi:hypothetical protein